MVASAIRSKGYVTIGWSVRSLDTVITDRSKLLKRIKGLVKGGDIVLFHDHSETMIQVLPDFLQAVADLGLKIVRVDELLNEKAYEG
jgi:peptidoglycan/xylan/chitin deacetylase (PgdA/CDA1 family)